MTESAEAPCGAEKYDESCCWQTHRYQLYGNDDEQIGEKSSEYLGHRELVITRSLAQPDVATKLEFIRKIRHQNFVMFTAFSAIQAHTQLSLCLSSCPW